MKRIAGLREIAGQFDLFLVDQFGVLHDGVTAYPGAIEGLAELASPERKIVVLTNSGKGKADNQARLEALGFSRASFDAVVSSGEVALQLVMDGSLGPGFARGSNVFVVGKAGDSYSFSSGDFTLVDRPERAAFIVIAGSDGPRTSLDAYRAMLRPAAEAGVPAICANPDILMLRDGMTLDTAPGGIAKAYEALGGRVEYVGKPYRAIFDHALALFDKETALRVVMIGDSPEHDVAGAKSMGLSTLLVRTGVQARLDEGELLRLCADHGGPPDFLLPNFKW